MKKVFAILAVVAFVACNSGDNKEATGGDTTSKTTATETQAGDTTKTPATETPAGDTTKKDK
jgi:hypothetical protein